MFTGPAAAHKGARRSPATVRRRRAKSMCATCSKEVASRRVTMVTGRAAGRQVRRSQRRAAGRPSTVPSGPTSPSALNVKQFGQLINTA